MHAMILAAGFGERLRPLTLERPKALLPLLGRPAIRYTIDWLRSAGIRRIVVNAHHLSDQVAQELGGEPEVAVLHEPRILGTGGGVRNALDLLGTEPFVVVNGKLLYAPDLDALVQAHRRLRAEATLLVRRAPDAERYNAVHFDAGGRVCAIASVAGTVPAGAEATFMFSGVHVVEPSLADLLPAEGCIVRKTYRAMIEQGRRLCAVESEAPWHEISTPAEYLRANLVLTGDRAVVDPTATVGLGASVIAPSVVGKGATIAAGVQVRRSVVWDGARADRSIDGAIVTPRTTVFAT